MPKLDIGCSFHKLPGYLGVDIEFQPGVDVIANFHKLPFRESSVDEIHTRHTLEHVNDTQACIAEMYRICRRGGIIYVIVPHYSNPAYWADLTHLRPFSARAFEYYDQTRVRDAEFPIYLPDVNLRTRRIRLTYWPRRIYIKKSFLKRTVISALDYVLTGLASWKPFLCERFWCYWVGGFYEVSFELEAVKPRD